MSRLRTLVLAVLTAALLSACGSQDSQFRAPENPGGGQSAEPSQAAPNQGQPDIGTPDDGGTES